MDEGSRGRIVITILSAIIVLAALSAIGLLKPAPPPAEPPPPPPRFDQARIDRSRTDLADLQRFGIIQSVEERDGYVVAMVGPLFYSYSIAEKRGVAGMLGIAYGRGALADVILKDDRTGEKIADLHSGQFDYHGRTKD